MWSGWLRTFVLAAVGFAAALHLLTAVAVAVIAPRLYPERIYDVRRFPPGIPFAELVSAWLKVTPGPLVAGSSFSFGYPLSAETAFPAHADLGNASVIGAGLSAIKHEILCQTQHRAELVVEIPLINEVSVLVHGPNAVDSVPLEAPCQPRSASLGLVALSHLLGSKWIRLLTDPYASERGERPIQIVKVPPDYFATPEEFDAISGQLRQRIGDVYALARQRADRVFLFVTPLYLPGVQEAGSDEENAARQFTFAEKVCVEVAGPDCIRTDALLERRDLYYNITHLNQAGHREFARLLRSRRTPRY